MSIKRLILLSFIVTSTVIGDAQISNPCADKWKSNVDVPASCWALKPTSKYHNAGTDGKDLGANIPLIDAMTKCVVSGGVDKESCNEYERLRATENNFQNTPRDLRIIRGR